MITCVDEDGGSASSSLKWSRSARRTPTLIRTCHFYMFYVGDHPRRGRSKRGQKLAIYANKSLRTVKFSLIMIIGTEGVADYKILSNNCKKVDIVSFFTKLQIPTGSTIVMDNLRAHHSKETIDVIKSKGWNCLFTPPYSPRTNPIEKVFGMIKPE